MSRRFEIARAIGSGNAGLFDAEDGAAAAAAPASRSCRTGCTSRRSSRSRRAHARGARPRELAAGMEHVPAGLAGFQL